MDIYKMIGYLASVYHIIGKVFPCTDVHSTEHLSRIGTNNLPA